MPDLNDFYDFKSTSDSSNKIGNGCGIGCFSPTIIIVAVIIFVIYLIGKLG